jgi:transposase-like protein
LLLSQRKKNITNDFCPKTCTQRNFIQEYTNKAYQPNVREQALKMTINGTGTRATGRVLGISKDTVTAIIKKHKSGSGK